MVPIKISATEAKLKFGSIMAKVKKGTPFIIEKNEIPEIVWISIDDFEDFLEIKDEKFQKGIEKEYKEMKKGKFGTLGKLYENHKQTIKKEAKR